MWRINDSKWEEAVGSNFFKLCTETIWRVMDQQKTMLAKVGKVDGSEIDIKEPELAEYYRK
jgi:hypothetical protein